MIGKKGTCESCQMYKLLFDKVHHNLGLMEAGGSMTAGKVLSISKMNLSLLGNK